MREASGLLERLGIRICFDSAGGVGGAGSAGSAGSTGGASSAGGPSGSGSETGAADGATGADGDGAAGPASDDAGSFDAALGAAADEAAGDRAAAPDDARDSMAEARAADRQSVAGYAADSPPADDDDRAVADRQAAEAAADRQSLDSMAAARAADRQSVAGYAADSPPADDDPADRQAAEVAADRQSLDAMAAARGADRQSVPGYAADSPPAPAAALDSTGFNPAINTELGGSYARSYDRALATIAADRELSAAVAMAERAGVADFRDRLANAMAGLEQNRPAALDAIRGEVFGSQVRSRTGVAAADAIASLATLNAFDRLAAMNPEAGVAVAREQGFRAAVNFAEQQRGAFYSIVSNSNLSYDQKMEALSRTGALDAALAGGLLGVAGLAYRGPAFGPVDRPGAVPAARANPAMPSTLNIQRVEQRATEIQATLDPRAQTHRTTAVLQTADGRTIVAAGGRDLSPAQRAALRADEIPARAPGLHAEVTALENAIAAGARPSIMSASRPFCDACAARVQELGGRMINERTAVWDR